MEAHLCTAPKSKRLSYAFNPMPAELQGQKIQYYTPSAKINYIS